MIAFQFDVHPMLMTIEVDMQDKRKIGNAVCYAFAGKIRILEICIFIQYPKHFCVYFVSFIQFAYSF